MTACSPDARSCGHSNAWLPSHRQLLFLIAAYLGLQFVARTLISQSAGIDEAWQVEVGQRLSWGYGPHAPLYTWLMNLFFRVFGTSTLALNLLREVLLFLVYYLTYLNGRKLTGQHWCGVLAVIALQFHPTVVWESQRELTNSIVASGMILAMVYSFLNLKPERLPGWIAFGLFGGLAILSKYNAGIFYAALLVATLSIDGLRARILNRRILLALLTTALVIAPNLVWVATHKHDAFSLVWKFGIHETMPWPQAVGRGTWHWVEALAAHVAPVIVAIGLFAWPFGSRIKLLRLHSAEERLLGRTLCLIIAMALGSVFLLKVTEFKDRWLQPMFITLPLFVVLFLRDALTPSRIRALILAGGVVTIAIGFLASGRLLFAEARGRRDVLVAPWQALCAGLQQPITQADFIVANQYWVGGNLWMRFPDKPVFSPDLFPPPTGAGKRALLVWDATKSDAIPDQLQSFATTLTHSAIVPAAFYIQSPWRFHTSKQMRLGYLLIQPD